MASPFSKNLPNKVKSWNLPLIIQVWIFILINLFFQLIWENFEDDINQFTPFVSFSDAIGNLLLIITPRILNPLFDVDIVRDGISLILPGGYYVNFLFYLSGIKQMCLVTLIILIVPGPWLKKLWFIPLNLVIIQLMVFGRFLILNVHCLVHPEHIYLLQDLLFGPMFYLEILVMWLVWVVIIAKTASLRNPVSEGKAH